MNIVNTRNVRTRAQDAILFTAAKYNKNVYYKGALSWNNLPVNEKITGITWCTLVYYHYRPLVYYPLGAFH